MSRRWVSMMSTTSRWCLRSSDSKGSSQSSSCGSPSSAWAMRSRCCSPPESIPMGERAKCVAPTAAMASSTRRRRRALGSPMPHRCPSRPSRTRSTPRIGRSRSKPFCCGMYPMTLLPRRGGAPHTLHRSRGQRRQPQQHLDQRGLAAAVGAEHRDELARAPREVEVLPQPAAPVGKTGVRADVPSARRRYGVGHDHPPSAVVSSLI